MRKGQSFKAFIENFAMNAELMSRKIGGKELLVVEIEFLEWSLGRRFYFHLYK